MKFDNVENYLLHSVVYGLMFEVDNRETKFDLKNAQKILGDDLCFDLMETESETILDKNTFGYFDKYHKINQVISKHGICFKFFEKRNMYRFLIKKKVQRKNEVTRNLSACFVEKFNGYETMRNELARKDKRI